MERSEREPKRGAMFCITGSCKTLQILIKPSPNTFISNIHLILYQFTQCYLFHCSRNSSITYGAKHNKRQQRLTTFKLSSISCPHSSRSLTSQWDPFVSLGLQLFLWWKHGSCISARSKAFFAKNWQKARARGGGQGGSRADTLC